MKIDYKIEPFKLTLIENLVNCHQVLNIVEILQHAFENLQRDFALKPHKINDLKASYMQTHEYQVGK